MIVNRGRWLPLAAGTLAASVAALGGVVVYAGHRWVRPKRLLLPEDVCERDGFRHVWLSSQDGTPLHGLYRHNVAGGPTVILCHGYQKSLAEPYSLGCRLAELGYNVLLLDFRGCGESGGVYTTLGRLEVLDLLGAVNYAKTLAGQDAPIGVLGISMGGATAIVASAQCPDIRAVVVDSAFATLDDAVEYRLQAMLHLPLLVTLGRVSIRLGEILTEGHTHQVRPIDHVAQISPRPILFIHGEFDDFLPTHHHLALFDAAKEPKELWLAPGSSHAMARLDHPEEYLQRVHTFFACHLIPTSEIHRAQV